MTMTIDEMIKELKDIKSRLNNGDIGVYTSNGDIIHGINVEEDEGGDFIELQV